MTAADVSKALKAVATPEKAKASSWFFKTGEGQYGFGDQFIGVTVPEQRKIARQFRDLPLGEVEKLLVSPIHEERLISLFLLVDQYKKGDEKTRREIYDFYLAHTKFVNNWDLVDSSAEFIVGPFLDGKDKSVLSKLAHSKLLWERRIAVIATFHYIRQGDPSETFKIIDILITDREDLIQKAVGWMLREVGKKSGHAVLENWLKVRYQELGRTALRYAIEHFDEVKRQRYLKGTM